jgi:lysophospholipase L1-like esterase
VRSISVLLGLCLFVGCGEGAAAPPKGPPALAATPVLARSADGTTEVQPPADAAIALVGDAAPGAAPAGAADAAPMGSAPIGHLESPDKLQHLFEALARLDDGHAHDDVRILQYGDSHTASDLGVAVMRRALQARFGDGGRGFVSIGKPWKTYGQDGVRAGMKDFEPVKTKYKGGKFAFGDGCFGLLGIGVGASKAGARAWTDLTARASHVEIDWWQQPGGGSFDVFIDGSRAGHVATRSPSAATATAGYTSFDVPEASHRVELRAAGDGDVRVFGMNVDRLEAGVVVDALGINGAQVFTPLRWNEEHFAEQLRHAAPDMVMLAYGTNEALEPGLADAEYERKVVDLLGRIARAMPAASCLLLGPPDLARHTKGKDDWKTWPRVLEIVAAQRRVAQAAGCGFFDQMGAMGGEGSIAAWAAEAEPRGGRDRVHLTRTGYAELATSFATDLMHAYDAWRAERGLPPTGAAKTWGGGTR